MRLGGRASGECWADSSRASRTRRASQATRGRRCVGRSVESWHAGARARLCQVSEAGDVKRAAISERARESRLHLELAAMGKEEEEDSVHSATRVKARGAEESLTPRCSDLGIRREDLGGSTLLSCFCLRWHPVLRCLGCRIRRVAHGVVMFRWLVQPCESGGCRGPLGEIQEPTPM